MFSDFDVRPNHVLISEDKWIGLFKDNGFLEPIGISDKIEGQDSLQTVILAQCFHILQTDKDVNENKIVEPSSIQNNRPWIIFADSQGVAEKLVDRFEEKGIIPIIVTKGDSFKKLESTNFIIHPDRPEDIEQLFNTVSNLSSPPVLINMWNLASHNINKIDSITLGKVTNDSCVEILHIVQVLIKRNWDKPPSLWLVTNGTQTVGGLQSLALEQTPLLGLGRVIITEHTNLKTRMIDLSPIPSLEEIDSLYEELISDDIEDEITLRGKKRYVHRLLKVKKTDAYSRSQIPFRIYKTLSKTTEEFLFEEMERKEPGQGEVEIQVKAIGINFKDIAKVEGILEPELNDNGLISNLGIECSGIVVSVGNGVENFQVGDEIMGFVTSCFANYKIANSRLIVHKPSYLTFEDAATIPIAFLTGYYLLYNLAKIQKNDRVLVHTATGGVDLSVIQIAHAAGAEVIATAKDSKKRNFFRAMGIKYVGSSSSLDFYEEIMRVTKGEGVDIVINTLPEKKMFNSMSLLKPVTGRFIDVGNIYSSETELKMSVLKEGISYFSFDLEGISKENPQLLESMWREIINDLNSKKIYALPYRVFSIADIADAFLCMKQTKHIGKIVVSLQEQDVTPVSTQEKIVVRKEGTYLITGGLGGFGLAVAKWLVDCGAKQLVLLGRSGDSKPEVKKAVKELRDMGTEVFVGSVDVTKEEQVENVLSTIDETMMPLRGIIHAAMVLDDVFVEQMNASQMKKVLDPKILGAWNLHIQTLNKDLDFFICFSSFSSLIGNSGQGNYSAGNSFLDSLSHHRRVQGLTALTICWGPMGEVGYVAEHEEVGRLFKHQGISEISLKQAWKVITNSLDNDLLNIGVMSIDWQKYNNYLTSVASPRFSRLFSKATLEEEKSGDTQSKFVLPDSPEEVKEYLTEKVAKSVAGVLGIASSKLNYEQPLERYGLDSLIAVELNARIKEFSGINLPRMNFLQKGLNIASLVKIIEKDLKT